MVAFVFAKKIIKMDKSGLVGNSLVYTPYIVLIFRN